MFWWTKGRKSGEYAGAYSVRKCPTEVIQARIVQMSEFIARFDGPNAHLQADRKVNGEQALDYLFAELGRRASRAVVP